MRTLLRLLFAFLLSLGCSSLVIAEEPSPELVVHLLDYLAKDYGGAVQNGRVISKGEYAEQLEFGGIVEKNSKGVSRLSSDAEFMRGISQLLGLIRAKGDSRDVSKLARKLQQDAIRLAEIQVAPTTKPDLALGKTLFQTNCVSCHGSTGRGDGIAGANLDPKPANFYDVDLIWNSAPYKFYNTIRLGVPGTGMASYSHLSDHEVWALAFYLKSLPYAATTGEQEASAELPLYDIATLTDAEIAGRIGKQKEEALALIGSLRSNPGGPRNEDPLKVADIYLRKSLEHAKAGDYQKAGIAALRSYLEGIEPVEPKIQANIPGAVEDIEGLMSAYRSSLNSKAPIDILSLKATSISKRLAEIGTQLSQNQMSPGVAFWASFSIFLREGFEAVLIIIVLISILRAMDQATAMKWVHAGWVSAVAVGIAGWFASGMLLSISGMSRELMEGAISVLAVAVLLYVGFWLHRYSEMKKWRAFLELKLRRGLNQGNYLALAIVAFMAVFREAIEVVLFLRAILLDLSSSGRSAVGFGVISSFVLLVAMSVLAVRESKRLPLGILFKMCSWTMVVLAFILAGKGAHSLQEAGFIGISTLTFWPRFDLLGIYPSIQTLTAQTSVMALMLYLFVSELRRRRSIS